MDATETRRELNRRLLVRGQEEYRRELAGGFPLLRSVKGTHARAALAAFERRTPGQRERLAEVLLKRTFGEPPGELALTPIEKATLSAFLGELLAFDDRADPRRPRPPPARIRRTALARALRDALRPVLGEHDRALTEWPRDLIYRSVVAGWTIDTTVDLSSRDRPICYSHNLRARNGGSVATVSLLSALGISSTCWTDLCEADIPAAAQAVAELCRRFFADAPRLLAGIEPPERDT